MKFTLWALCPPAVLFLIAILGTGPASQTDVFKFLALVAMIWGCVAFGVTVVYWIVRVVRRAAGDGSRTQQYQPPRY